jgi:transposase
MRSKWYRVDLPQFGGHSGVARLAPEGGVSMNHAGRWPKEFREHALIVYLSRRHEASARTVALELGIPANTLRRWIKQHDAQAQEMNLRDPNNAREVARLTSQNEALREENEILKKAAAFFARETGSNPPPPSDS